MNGSFGFLTWPFLLVGLFIGSCHHEQQQQMVSQDSLKEHLIKANKISIENESKLIDDFISRHQWKMTLTGTGLRYEIYSHENGKGKKAENEKQVTIAYTLYFADGTLCYPADAGKPITFILGHGQQPHGLEEGILFMHEGDRARLVVPAHLGYGMTGDDDKIPGRSILYYEVTLLKVNDTK